MCLEVAFALEGNAAYGTGDDGAHLLVAQQVFAHRLTSVGHEAALKGKGGSEGERWV